MNTHPIGWRVVWFTIAFAPMTYLYWIHGMFEFSKNKFYSFCDFFFLIFFCVFFFNSYLIRRRHIKPLEPQWDSEYPKKPPEGYENPLFEPGRKWAKIRAERRAQRTGIFKLMNR